MKDFLVDNKTLYNFEYYFLSIFSKITIVVVVLFLVGIFQEKPLLYLKFNFFVKILLALFLIYRFNSYRNNKIVFTELDRKVCYSAGKFILVFSFIDYFNHYTYKIREVILPYSEPIIHNIKARLLQVV